MNGTVRCRWALRKRGAERRGGAGGRTLGCWWMLEDLPRPTPPKVFRNRRRVSKQFQNTLPENHLATTQE